MSALADDPHHTAIDETVTSWPEVKGKQVFGHRGWVRGHTMIGFLAGEGVAVKLVGEIDAEELLSRDGVELFAYNGMPMNGWAVVPVRDDADMDDVIGLVHTVWESVAR